MIKHEKKPVRYEKKAVSPEKKTAEPEKKPRKKESVLDVREPSELMKFLVSRLPDQSRSAIKSLLSHKQVSVNNRTVSQFNHPLLPGQQVVVTWGHVDPPFRHPELRIIFEDDYFIVIEKKAGLLSIATDKEKNKTAYSIISNYVKRADPKNKIFVLHRLDKNTSGLMMFARSQEIQTVMQKKWNENIDSRSYVALVEGCVARDKGTLMSYLLESKAFIMYSSRSPKEGQRSVTHFEVLKKNDHFSLLKLILETGRKNQIRVHMQDMGHPVTGDIKYGAQYNPVRRMGLHAYLLAFTHPVTGEAMHFETPIPQCFLGMFPENPPKTQHGDTEVQSEEMDENLD